MRESQTSEISEQPGYVLVFRDTGYYSEDPVPEVTGWVGAEGRERVG